MPNTRETLRALVGAFNVNNYDFNAVKTNFTLQSRGKGSYIVVSFDRGMDRYQCSRYLDSIKRKIIREFYGIKESNDAEILDTAKLIFDVNSFPFDISEGDWSWDEQHGFKFVTPVDKGVIFNLKSHLASSLEKNVLEDMQISSTTVPFNKGKYLCCSKFPDKESRKQFECKFLSRMREKYENAPKNPLKVKGNSVYIRDVFDDARFIDSVTRRAAWLIGRDLQADSKSRSDVRAFKDLIIEFINQSIELTVAGFMCAPPLNGKGASILIPVILDSKGFRALTNKEALSINSTFDGAVFVDIDGKTQAELPVNGSSGIYGINFYDLQISHCVITKIIESSVINKDHELSIDPELHFRALSPVQSPFNSPTHAEPSGLRTPLNQRKRNSGYDSNPPPKPKDSGSSSGGPGPSTELSDMEWESPTRSQDGVLKESPRQGLEEPFMLHRGTSEEFPLRTYISSATIKLVVSEPSSSLQSVGATQNVSAGPSAWSQPMNPWSSPASSAGLWSLPQSGPSSSKGANPVGANPWSQPMGTWALPASSAGLWSLPQSRPSSSKGASERRTSDKPLIEEEKNLFKELLYAFNLNNYILEYPNTNFIVKNGKIASSINDGVDVKEYLKELRNFMIEEYYRTEEKAKEACDLNEFPFKFLSNCEKNQETTVVANIGRGALFNLKKLFIREHERKVEIKDIDINIVKRAVKSKKDEWVDSQVKKCKVRPREAITTCYPDESELEHIPIIKDKGGYWLDRTYETWEVESFLKGRRCAKGTSVTGKVKSEDNKDSSYSSVFVTDAENVSSKAEATTSGYESMDCENTGGELPKRKSPSPEEDGGGPRKSPKRDSLPFSRLESLSLSNPFYQIDKY
ncbi:MAG: hypothetical protein LBE46_04865 [Wolbachia pipientis]|jgi:hypothetical protein|nr:hypothetical protein [Wolbachia pipientis]